MAKTFLNPANNYTEKTDGFIFLWYLLFGPLYFLYKGMYGWAVISLISAVFTYGFSHFFLCFFAPMLVDGHYRKSGWIEVVVQ